MSANSPSAGFISVSTAPGCTLLIVIPPAPQIASQPFHRSLQRRLAHRVNAATFEGIRSAFVLPILMMHVPSFMCLIAACMATNTARTLMASVGQSLLA